MADVVNTREEAEFSLRRIQEFDVEDLVQAERLGASNFRNAVDPAKRILTLFNQLPLTTLDYFPDPQLEEVKSQANSLYGLLTEILEFDVDAGDVTNRQKQVVQRLDDQYRENFTQLFPLISYSMARSVDFNKLESQGRAAVQSIRDETEKLMKEIELQKVTASEILNDVRKAAAEQGVSQQAKYFMEEAESHAAEAKRWRWWTVAMAVVVGAFGISTLFLHKIPLIAPQNIYETIQFTIGKLIVFGVLAYMLSLCGRNFLSNRHNEIVNRHRQNALMTYKALVDAGGTPEARDVILNHAASSVYRLHDTGYTKTNDAGSSS
ncbi:MAG: hypothetical protein IT488_13700, partial [Gammaproteobacteria bacterium]|nr:hypothetical protein [Gammaproteobacteria bacterium]